MPKLKGDGRVAAKRVEVEIKLRVEDRAAVERKLRRLGFVLHTREREQDVVLDTTQGDLRQAGRLLRLRRHGRRWTLTFKGRAADGTRYKSRPETEVEIADGGRLLEILAALGYQPVFRYEKVRSNYRPREDGGRAVASLDRTPIGNFLELEGPRRWIDRTARALGFAPRDYITRSYGFLYEQYCRERGRKPADMLFRS